MTFDEILDRAIEMLRRRKRLSYRALKRQFDLDDDYLEDLTLEIIKVQQLGIDQDGEMLVWTGDTEAVPETTWSSPGAAQSAVSQQDQPPTVEPTLPESPKPDAERRQLTVMFCDLADSTRLSGQLDLEDLRDVIRAYQDTGADVIERDDGYIAQHLGDGLMVYFGWPRAHEDDAQRAVHAGLGILEAMQELNSRLEREKGVCLAVRIGIHTGLVVVGEIGKGASQEHLALGETPNVASRIEGMAERDTVAISQATHQLVQGYFICEDLGQHALKGVHDAQQVYRVVRASGVQSRLEVGITRGLTPLVGRESETTLLFERWQHVRDGQGQVVLLSGEAGIGKSRLVHILREHVAGEPHSLLECRSLSYYQHTALYPITDMLQRTLQWQQDDTVQEKLDTLEQTLREYRLDLQAMIPLFATLLSLSLPQDRYPPLNLAPQLQRQKTLETIVAMLLRQTEQHPVLLILEDLHWTDHSTLELLNLLIEQTPTARICCLLTCRPGFQPPWSSRSYLTEVTVSRLSRKQIQGMAERVAGGKSLPTEVMRQIIEKTDGVPLFVEEMTKAVLESGTLKEANGQYDLACSISTLAIPATLQDSLMARLDRLVTAKAIAQYASVIGRQFSYELLQAVSQLDEGTLQTELSRLVEAEIVYQRGLPPQAMYLFKHALIQDTAYASLLKRTRQQYHQRIAEVLEAQFQETKDIRPELLAHHYTEAGLTEPAVIWWQRAGETAFQKSAMTEAIGHLTQGVDLLNTLADSPQRMQRELDMQILLGRSLAFAQTASAPETQRAYTRARVLCDRLGNTHQLYDVLVGFARYYQDQGKYQHLQEINEQLLALAQDQHDTMRLVEAHNMLGQCLRRLGDLATARHHLEQAIHLYDTHAPPLRQATRLEAVT